MVTPRIDLNMAIEDPARPLHLSSLLAYLGMLNATYETLLLADMDLPLESAQFRELKSSRPQLLRLLHRARLKAQLPTSGLVISETPEPLVVLRISFESPLKIALAGAIGALTLSVIVSGGTIKISPDGVEANLPPISRTISDLRKALGPGPVEVKLQPHHISKAHHDSSKKALPSEK